MPIIPRYNLTQTSTHVSIEVSIPHVRVSTSTLDLVIVDGTELHLYAPPTYLLKLTLPDSVVDEDSVEESLARAATGSGVVCAVEADENYISEVSTARTTYIWTKEDLPKLQYNPEKNHGTLVVVLRKEQEKYWQDLDLLGRLQQPPAQQQLENPASKTKRTTNPLIKVIDADCSEVEVDEVNSRNDTPQAGIVEDLLSIDQDRLTYGLFQHYSNVFRDYARAGLAHEMLECPNPDEIFACENGRGDEQDRREMRLEMENEKFDSDRYVNDLCVEEEGDMIFDAAMAMLPHWVETSELPSSEKSVENITHGLIGLEVSKSDKQNAFFSSDESHLLATLPPRINNPVQLSTEQKRSVFLSLTDVLFAYAYDHRTTDGDPTVESSRTAMILSPSLSWLEHYNAPYDTVVEVVQWSLRRALIYPYLRSYTLATKVVEDVSLIVKGGRRIVIRCLLQLHRVMEKSESHYLFNKLYIDPLIGWIQQCEESEVLGLGREIGGLLIDSDLLSKQCLDLDLAELEKSFFECGDDEEPSSPEEQ